MIPKETIDEIFSVSRIEEVLGEFLNLKKSGANYKALSPFSDEKTPSFVISPAKQIWKDFSSGKGGNVVSFLMEHESYTYPEALKFLAKKYNIEIIEEEISDEKKEQISQRESMYLVNEFAQTFFQKQLKTNTGKAIGFSYFVERGYSLETIKKFSLGYCPNQWTAFTDEALKNKYDLEFLQKTGLTIVKGDKQFDRFKGRVMFPIHSFSGRVLGFGGRTMESRKDIAKYLNSPESDIYHKSNILYGIFQAKQNIIKQNRCVLVEGYTDVISMFQSGVKNVVASSGTALTEKQIRLIKRLTDNVTLIYDGDNAGVKASFRGIDLMIEQDINVRILPLPEGHDPDSFSKEKTESELEDYIKEKSLDFVKYKARILKKIAGNDPVKKSETINNIISTISKINNIVKREIYVRECADILSVNESMIFAGLAQLDKKNKIEESKSSRNPRQILEVNNISSEKISSLHTQETAIIKMLLLHGEKKVSLEGEDDSEIIVAEQICNSIMEDKLSFENGIYQEIFDEICNNIEREILDYKYFSSHERMEIVNITASLISENYKLDNWKKQNIFVSKPEDNIYKELNDILYRFKNEKIKSMLIEIDEKMKNNTDVEIDLIKKRMLLKDLYNKIDENLFRII